MRRYAYIPTVGDEVTTVSLSRGRVEAIDGDVLTLEHTKVGQHGIFYASVGAVIRVKTTQGLELAFEHKPVRDRALQYHTTAGANLFNKYFVNKKGVDYAQSRD